MRGRRTYFTVGNPFFPLLLLLLVVACAFGRAPERDGGISAIEGQDLTCPVEGCGFRPIPGYTYCRKVEGGDATKEVLAFVGPRTNCKRDHCAEFKVFPPDGSMPFGDAIPKNAFRKEVPWEKLLHRKTFELGDRGFWPFTCRVWWVDKDGNENESVSEGEIRLRVIRKDYIPLNQVENDNNFAWDFSTRNGERIKMTTGMRVFVGYPKN